MSDNNKKTVEEIRQETYNDMLSKLNKEPHIVAVPRPTGFGKTCMATDLIKEKDYKKILYLYPAAVVKDAVLRRYFKNYDDETEELMAKLKQMKNVTMMTYAKLAKLDEDDYDLLGYDLIIFDECHRMAATKSLPKAEALIRNNKAHVIGLTATPNRSDGFDVIEKIFQGITVFPYTLHDAFQDGIYKVPHYCYLPCDQSGTPRKLFETAFMAGEDIDDLKVKYVMKRKIIEVANICNMVNAIRDTCDKIVNTDYMKFVCFFSTHNNLLRLSKVIKGWFHEAYPEHIINMTEVSSRTRDVAKNVEALKELSYKPLHIDLILCVDMLNMGYHVDDITGIVMYRTTTSDIIFPQEYGRILASGDINAHVVFDVVDNLHRNAIYRNPITPTGGLTEGPENGTGIDIIPPTTGGNGGGHGDGKTTGGDNGDIDIIPPKTETDGPDGTEIPPTKGGKDTPPPWWKIMNDLGPTDIKEAPFMATYKEQIAKLVAEPMQMRCKEAFEAHFKRWCIMNNVPYPITNKQLKEVYQLDKKDFVEYFENLIKTNQIDYPLRDAEKLIEIGKKRKDGLPIEIFARWKNISVTSILELLDVA